MNKKVEVKIGSSSLITVVTAIFIVLKITGFINWSWFWVLSPIWISLAIAVAVFGIMAVILMIRRARM